MFLKLIQNLFKFFSKKFPMSIKYVKFILKGNGKTHKTKPKYTGGSDLSENEEVVFNVFLS